MIDYLPLIGFGAGDSVSVKPEFISPIWELVSERNNCDDIPMKDTNIGKGGGKREEKGEVKVNSTHTAQSLPSASYSQSFQGF